MIEIATDFQDFDDYWTPFLGGQGPAPGYVQSLSDERRAALRERIWTGLPFALDGSIHLAARAWAARGFGDREPPTHRVQPTLARCALVGGLSDSAGLQSYAIGSGGHHAECRQPVILHRLKRLGRGWAHPNGQSTLAVLRELHGGRFAYTWLRLTKTKKSPTVLRGTRSVRPV
jgi:hypothetical protein